MAIEVKNISYTYPGSTVTAVENVSMKIEKGERVAIIGQNGAGKSTTVKLMNNIYKPTSGEIIIDGINTKNQTTAQTAPHVGYVVSAKYCYAAHESRLHQNDRCKRFALCLVLTVRFRSLAPWGKLFQLFI